MALNIIYHISSEYMFFTDYYTLKAQLWLFSLVLCVRVCAC